MAETVAVLIPTYNRLRYITECIQSVLKGSHQDVVVYVQDDGSTDGTQQAIEAINDPRIRYERFEYNIGVPGARNRLMARALADGHTIGMWQDSDDIAHPKRVQMLLRMIQGHDMAHSSWVKFTNSVTFPGINIKAQATPPKGCMFATIMFRLGDVPQFNEMLQVCGEDTLWWKTIIKQGKKIAFANIALYGIRQHAEQMTKQCRERRIEGTWGDKTLAQFIHRQPHIWNGRNHVRIGGIKAQQNNLGESVLRQVRDSEHFDAVLEIGTGYGAVSALMAETLPVFTFDTVLLEDGTVVLPEPMALDAIVKTGGRYYPSDWKIHPEAYPTEAKLLCLSDGGDKPGDFKLLYSFLRRGSVIGVHDYWETRKEFRQRRGTTWDWCECTYEDIEEVAQHMERIPVDPNSHWSFWRKQ